MRNPFPALYVCIPATPGETTLVSRSARRNAITDVSVRSKPPFSRRWGRKRVEEESGRKEGAGSI